MALQTFNCQQIYDEHYLYEDMTVQCYDDQWLTRLPLSLLAVLLYPVGVPVFFFSILYRNRGRLNQDGILARYGDLYSCYKPEYFYYEIVEMSRKLLLTGIVIYIKPGTGLQLLVAVCISCIFLMLHTDKKPFKNEEDNTMQFFALIATPVTLLSAYAIQLSRMSSTQGEYGSWLLPCAMISINALVLLLVVVISASRVREAITVFRRSEVPT